MASCENGRVAKEVRKLASTATNKAERHPKGRGNQIQKGGSSVVPILHVPGSLRAKARRGFGLSSAVKLPRTNPLKLSTPRVPGIINFTSPPAELTLPVPQGSDDTSRGPGGHVDVSLGNMTLGQQHSPAVSMNSQSLIVPSDNLSHELLRNPPSAPAATQADYEAGLQKLLNGMDFLTTKLSALQSSTDSISINLESLAASHRELQSSHHNLQQVVTKNAVIVDILQENVSGTDDDDLNPPVFSWRTRFIQKDIDDMTSEWENKPADCISNPLTRHMFNSILDFVECGKLVLDPINYPDIVEILKEFRESITDIPMSGVFEFSDPQLARRIELAQKQGLEPRVFSSTDFFRANPASQVFMKVFDDRAQLLPWEALAPEAAPNFDRARMIVFNTALIRWVNEWIAALNALFIYEDDEAHMFPPLGSWGFARGSLDHTGHVMRFTYPEIPNLPIPSTTQGFLDLKNSVGKVLNRPDLPQPAARPLVPVSDKATQQSQVSKAVLPGPPALVETSSGDPMDTTPSFKAALQVSGNKAPSPPNPQGRQVIVRKGRAYAVAGDKLLPSTIASQNPDENDEDPGLVNSQTPVQPRSILKPIDSHQLFPSSAPITFQVPNTADDLLMDNDGKDFTTLVGKLSKYFDPTKSERPGVNESILDMLKNSLHDESVAGPTMFIQAPTIMIYSGQHKAGDMDELLWFESVANLAKNTRQTLLQCLIAHTSGIALEWMQLKSRHNSQAHIQSSHLLTGKIKDTNGVLFDVLKSVIVKPIIALTDDELAIEFGKHFLFYKKDDVEKARLFVMQGKCKQDQSQSLDNYIIKFQTALLKAEICYDDDPDQLSFVLLFHSGLIPALKRHDFMQPKNKGAFKDLNKFWEFLRQKVQKSDAQKEIEDQINAESGGRVASVNPAKVTYTKAERAAYGVKMRAQRAEADLKRPLPDTPGPDADAVPNKKQKLPQVRFNADPGQINYQGPKLDGGFVRMGTWHSGLPFLAEDVVLPPSPPWVLPNTAFPSHDATWFKFLDAYCCIFPEAPKALVTTCLRTSDEYRIKGNTQFSDRCIIHNTHKHSTLDCKSFQCLFPGTPDGIPVRVPPVAPALGARAGGKASRF